MAERNDRRFAALVKSVGAGRNVSDEMDQVDGGDGSWCASATPA